MRHKTYRICLLLAAAAAVIGGILYYRVCVREDSSREKGVLVKQMQEKGEKLKEAGRQV